MYGNQSENELVITYIEYIWAARENDLILMNFSLVKVQFGTEADLQREKNGI